MDEVIEGESLSEHIERVFGKGDEYVLQEGPFDVRHNGRTFAGKTEDDYVAGDDDIFERVLKRHEKIKQEAYDRAMKGIE